jgi:hypothetical protein
LPARKLEKDGDKGRTLEELSKNLGVTVEMIDKASEVLNKGTSELIRAVDNIHMDLDAALALIDEVFTGSSPGRAHLLCRDSLQNLE